MPFNLADDSGGAPTGALQPRNGSHGRRTDTLSFANHLRAWGPAACWAAVLFFLSATPDLGGASWLPFSDKLAHFGLYAIMGGALAWGGHRSGGVVGSAWLIAVGLLYALSDEWHQAYVPGRFSSVADWLADAAGLLAGHGTTSMFLGRRKDGKGDD